jgi:hypothetical protein
VVANVSVALKSFDMFITSPTKAEVQRLTLKVKALKKFGNY